MSITDELRTEARGFGEHLYKSEQAHRLLAIADRIDAEHEEAIQQVLMGEGGMPATDENMAEHGWIRLPKDADGEYIHIGDVMEWIDLEGKVSVTCVVEAVGVDAFIAWDKANGRYAQCVTAYRHHHAPTVEDVLREFAEKMNENIGLYTGEVIDAEEWRDADKQTIAEYAKRLKLAGEGE